MHEAAGSRRSGAFQQPAVRPHLEVAFLVQAPDRAPSRIGHVQVAAKIESQAVPEPGTAGNLLRGAALGWHFPDPTSDDRDKHVAFVVAPYPEREPLREGPESPQPSARTNL